MKYRRRAVEVEAEPDGRGYYVRRLNADGIPGWGAGWVSREEFERDYEPVPEVPPKGSCDPLHRACACHCSYPWCGQQKPCAHGSKEENA